MQSVLVLEDGRVFRGVAAGAAFAGQGEVVFNTSMSGYQEIFTDPSYTGQIVCLTNPQIGNYGTNADDDEAAKPYIEGLVVREFSSITSNWRSQEACQAYLERHRVPVIAEIDTRALVRHLREHGVKRGIIAAQKDFSDSDIARLRQRTLDHPKMDGTDLAKVVTTRSGYEWRTSGDSRLENPYRVVAYDFGIKRNILRQLAEHGCATTVVPATTLASEVIGMRPDGVFLSNGPGDPEPCNYAVDNIKRLLGRVPIFGICLGHQLTGLALGGKTYKLKFGHHGGNHPVRHEPSGRIEITAHNHNFAVDPESLDATQVEMTHFDLNDGTLEGMRHRTLPLYSVQYHPEAAPGPHDSHYLFREFTQLMDEGHAQA